MIHIPNIVPVRDKNEKIRLELIDPGSSAFYFPPSVGPRIVFLDPRFDYPSLPSATAEEEVAKQLAIWKQLEAAGVSRFTDRHVEETVGSARTNLVRKVVFNELNTRHSAEFYERAYGDLLGQEISVVAISTGVSPWDGYNYHDIASLV